jgi:predicted nucleotidyltransferase
MTVRTTARLNEQVRLQILEVLWRWLSPAEWDVTLFGSFARGTATLGSDIDIALKGPSPLPMATAAQIVADLEEAIPLLRDFDLIDLSRANPALTDRVEAEGESWHRAMKAA